MHNVDPGIKIIYFGRKTRAYVPNLNHFFSPPLVLCEGKKIV
jgi:hypothetical protein